MVVSFQNIDMQNPVLILRNLDGTAIQSLGFAKDISLDLCYNEVSTINFSIPSQVEGNPTPGYASVVGMKIVDLKGVGQFILVDPVETNDGLVKIKTCKGYSLEYEFAKKNIYLEEGTYNFFDGVSASNDKTIVGRIMEVMPDWTFSIDPNLSGVYRTFGNTNKKVYDFIKTDVQKSYGCIFDFDTYNRVIHVLAIGSSVPTKPIFLSTENLIKEININEDSDNIITCLDVNGADGVNIRRVNPTGENQIYNLDYFMTLDNFSQELIDKWHSWEALVDSNRAGYAAQMSLYNLRSMKEIVEENILKDLEGELTVLQNQRAVIVQGLGRGMHTQSDLDTINNQIAGKESEIQAQRMVIGTINAQKNDVWNSIKAIQESVAMTAYFTDAELQSLRRYFIEDSLEDPTFVISEVASYDNTDLSSIFSSCTLLMSGYDRTTVNAANGEYLTNYVGGLFSLRINGTTIQAMLVNATMSRQNNSVVYSAYLSGGTIGSDNSFDSATITITGAVNPSSIIEMYDSVRKKYSVTIPITSGRLYLTPKTTGLEQTRVESDLLEYGTGVLAEKASPTYTFDVPAANFLRLDDFVSFKNNLTLGQRIYLKIDDNVLEPYVINVHVEYEDPGQFSIKFSDTYTAFDKSFALSKLLEQSISMGKTLSSKSGQYASFVDSGASNKIREFMNNALDIAKNNVMSSGEQAITFDDAGIRVRRYAKDQNDQYILDSYGNRTYEPEEIWIVGNTIAFTDDSWQTAKLGIGKIIDQNLIYRKTNDSSQVSGKTYYTDSHGTVWNGSSPAWNTDLYEATDGSAYGVVADYLVGKMLIGGNLLIDTDNGHFKVDDSGVYINSLKFTITHGDNSSETLEAAINALKTADAQQTAAYSTINTKLSAITGGDQTTGYYLKSSLPNQTISTVIGDETMIHGSGNVIFNDTGIWVVNGRTVETSTKALWMNDLGIIFGNRATASSDQSTWQWGSAIDYTGMAADAIVGKTLAAVDIIGRSSLTIGSPTHYQKTKDTSPVASKTYYLDTSGTRWDPSDTNHPWSNNLYEACKYFHVDDEGNMTAHNGHFTGELDAAVINGGLFSNRGSYISEPTVYGGMVIGGQFHSTGIGVSTGDTAAYYVTDGQSEVLVGNNLIEVVPNPPIGWLSYDQSGAGTESEAQYRVFLTTVDKNANTQNATPVALKIQASGNMSLSAGGAGGVGELPTENNRGHIFFNSSVCLMSNVSYGTASYFENSVKNQFPRNGQMFFVLDD